MLGLMVWSTGPELHIWAGREPPNESSLPGTHHFGQANQSGGQLDAREGSSQIIQVSKVLHSRGPSAGAWPTLGPLLVLSLGNGLQSQVAISTSPTCVPRDSLQNIFTPAS